MFISELNVMEREQQSIEQHTMTYERKHMSYPCSQCGDTSPHDLLTNQALEIADNFESYIDSQLPEIIE